MSQVLGDVADVIRTVFGDPDQVVTESTTAADVDGWDSLMHLNLCIALEKKFGIRFSTAEISEMKEDGQNIGTLSALIARKKGHSA